MKTETKRAVNTFGSELVDSLRLSDTRLNLLFASLILTSFGVLLGGNFLLLDIEVVFTSVPIGFVCLGVILIAYMCSRVLGGPIWGLALTYLLLTALVFIGASWLRVGFYGLSLTAILYALNNLRLNRSQWMTVFLMAVIATATVLGVERAYTSFDMLPRLHAGRVHQDTLFHASIAAMIKNYGVVSTGLHGLVETPYHAFSHMLMAGISLASGAGVLEVYGVANWTLFAPLLIFGITAFCAMVDRTGRFSLPVAWGVAALSLVVLPWALKPWAVWDSFFVSESYLVSLGLFVLGLGLLFKRTPRTADLLLVTLLALLIASAKLSVGMIFAGLWLTRFLFSPGERPLLDLAAFGLAAVSVGWIVADVVRATAGSMLIEPFHFVRNYSFGGDYVSVASQNLLSGTKLQLDTIGFALFSILSFWVIHFSVSWSLIGWSVRRRGLLASFRSPLVMYSLAVVFAGSVIVALFAIPGGSAFYFSNVALFVSLPPAIAIATGWLQNRVTSPDHNWLLATGIVVVIMISWGSYYDGSSLNPRHTQQTKNPLIETLLVLRDVPNQNAVLRADAEMKTMNPVSRCTAKPFVYPAVSERPWAGVIDGGTTGCPYRNYGYMNYGLSASEQDVATPVRLLPGMKVYNVSIASEQK